MNVNVYEQGIENIRNLSKKTLEKIQRKYKREMAFNKKCKNIRYRNKIECGNLKTIISESQKCKDTHKKNNATKKAKCILDLTQRLEKSLKFEDFRDIVGIRNLYVYGQINGFRKDSETLIKPINSNTIGNIASRHWNGPIEGVRDILGLQSGEFNGSWMRESIR